MLYLHIFRLQSANSPISYLRYDNQKELIMLSKDFWLILRIIYVIVKALVGMNSDDVNGDLTPKNGD